MKISNVLINVREQEVKSLLDKYLSKEERGGWRGKDVRIKDITSVINNGQEATSLKISHPEGWGFSNELDYTMFDMMLYRLKYK